MFGHVSQSIGRALPGGGGDALPGDIRFFDEDPRAKWLLGSKRVRVADYPSYGDILPKKVFEWQRDASPYTPAGVITSNLLVSGTVLLAVFRSSTGYIYRSLDGGETWGAQIDLGFTAGWGTYTKVAANNAGVVVAYATDSLTGGGGSVRVSTDYGATWGAITSIAAYAKGEAYFFEHLNGVFYLYNYNGSGRRLTTSTDGVTWTASNSVMGGSVPGAVYADGSDVIILNGSSSSSANRSSDNGATWVNTFSTPYSSTAKAVAVGATHVTIAAHFVFSSTDSGTSWTSRSLPDNVTSPFTDLKYSADEGYFVATKENGDAYVSTDGVTWPRKATTTSSAIPAEGKLHAVAYSSVRKLFVSLTAKGVVQSTGIVYRAPVVTPPESKPGYLSYTRLP